MEGFPETRQTLRVEGLNLGFGGLGLGECFIPLDFRGLRGLGVSGLGEGIIPLDIKSSANAG